MTHVVCRVSSGEPQIIHIYNLYMINNGVATISLQLIQYIELQKTYTISLQKIFESKLNLSSKRMSRTTKATLGEAPKVEEISISC